MRSIPEALQSHLNQNATTTCRLLKFRLKSGTVFGITNLDRPVPYDDGSGDGEIVYSALQGFNPSAQRSDIGNTVDNAEVHALIAEDGSGIQLTNIDAGELDDATWDAYLVNFMDTSQGHVHLGTGDVGEVSQRNGMQWTAELLSLDVRLRQPIGGVWSKRCRAIFGSPANSPTGCGVDASGLWVSGTVTAVGAEADREFTGNDITGIGQPAPAPGRVQFLTGKNAGREFAVESIGVTTPTVAPANAVATVIASASDSWSIDVPDAEAGDLILFAIAWDDSTTVSSVAAPTGPNGETISSITGPGYSRKTFMRMQAWYTKATGAWSAGTLDFNPSASESCRAVVARIPAGDFDPDLPIGAAEVQYTDTDPDHIAFDIEIGTPILNAGATDGAGRLVLLYGSDGAEIEPATGSSVVNSGTGGGVGLLVATRNKPVLSGEHIKPIYSRNRPYAGATAAFVVRPVFGNAVALIETTNYAIEVGDTYRIRPECGKDFRTDCINVWSNGPNFKGEPHISTGDGSQSQTPLAQLVKRTVGKLVGG